MELVVFILGIIHSKKSKARWKSMHVIARKRKKY
jgi:hypothetical protein